MTLPVRGACAVFRLMEIAPATQIAAMMLLAKTAQQAPAKAVAAAAVAVVEDAQAVHASMYPNAIRRVPRAHLERVLSEVFKMKKQLLALITGAAIGASGTAVTIQGEEVEAAQIAPKDLYDSVGIDDLHTVKFARSNDGVRVRANLVIKPSIEGFQSWVEKINISGEEGTFDERFSWIEEAIKPRLCERGACEGKAPKMVTLRATAIEGGYNIETKFIDDKWSAHHSEKADGEMSVFVKELISSVIDRWCDESKNEICK